jgi:hypothetical protein
MMKQTLYQQEVESVTGRWGYPGTLTDADEREWLMSLALDGELSPEAEARLNELMTADADADEQWQVWQALDAELTQRTHVPPPAGFAERVGEQLVLQERRRRLRTGTLFALAAFSLWGTMVAGLAAIGAFVWNNQVVWAGSALGSLTYWVATLGQLTDTLLTSVRTLFSAPEAQLVMGCYVLGAAVILLMWVSFLRRSLHSVPQENR